MVKFLQPAGPFLNNQFRQDVIPSHISFAKILEDFLLRTIPQNSLIIDSTPLLVRGISLITILNLNTSDWIYHCTPSTLSIYGESWSMLMLFMVFALWSSGIASSTWHLLLIHFVSLNPHLAHMETSTWYKVIACSFEAIETRQSST